jgi:hypothetical protein
MLPRHRRDLDRHDLVHHLVHDPVLRQSMVHLDDNFHQLWVHQNRYVVGIAMANLVHPLDAVMMDVQQNLDVLNLDEVLTFLVAVHHFPVNPVVAQVGEELRHLLKMDYYLDEVGVELRYLLNHLLKTDYCLDEELL